MASRPDDFEIARQVLARQRALGPTSSGRGGIGFEVPQEQGDA
jgi:hypothetical protein